MSHMSHIPLAMVCQVGYDTRKMPLGKLSKDKCGQVADGEACKDKDCSSGECITCNATPLTLGCDWLRLRSAIAVFFVCQRFETVCLRKIRILAASVFWLLGGLVRSAAIGLRLAAI